MRVLFETVFGSRLYGTETPESDYDYKGVYVPSPAEILLPRTPDVKTFNTGSKTEKNTSEDTDRELYSLHKFFDMLAKGDMNATELLFAPHDGSCLDWEVIVDNRNRLLSRECKGMVGYVKRQANVYSVRGDRLNEVRQTYDFLSYLGDAYLYTDKLESVPGIVERIVDFCEGKSHTSWEFIDNQGKSVFHLVCCDRKVPLTVTLGNAMKVYMTVWEEYGARARKAAENDGVDWKAVSHAVRIGEQAVELLMTGEITFPRPNAERLKSIKRGDADYAEVTAELDFLLSSIEQLATSSTLPEKPDREYMAQLVHNCYSREVTRETVKRGVLL